MLPGLKRRRTVPHPVYSQPEQCRRDSRQADRRQNNLKAFFCSFFMNRRHQIRRQADQSRGHYVDVHEPALLGMILATVLLCVADAYFTIAILAKGGTELNPFMRLLIERDVQLFFVIKFVMTSVCLVFTVIHKHFRLFNRISGYHILYAVFSLYLVLIYYEIGLLNA